MQFYFPGAWSGFRSLSRSHCNSSWFANLVLFVFCYNDYVRHGQCCKYYFLFLFLMKWFNMAFQSTFFRKVRISKRKVVWLLFLMNWFYVCIQITFLGTTLITNKILMWPFFHKQTWYVFSLGLFQNSCNDKLSTFAAFFPHELIQNVCFCSCFVFSQSWC